MNFNGTVVRPGQGLIFRDSHAHGVAHQKPGLDSTIHSYLKGLVQPPLAEEPRGFK